MINSKHISNGILRALAIIIGILILLFFLYKISAVIVYIAIAGVISLVGRPIVIFLRRKLKLKNTLAVVITMMLFIFLFIGLASLFIPLIKDQGKKLALLDINSLEQNVNSVYTEVVSYLNIHNIDVESSIKESQLLDKVDFSVIPNLFETVIGGLGSLSIGLFSVLFISFFFLKDSQIFESSILSLIPKGNEHRTKRSISKIKDLLSRYFVGLIFQILILFIIYTIVLLLFGIENAVVIAFLCALLNLIPYIGPLISGVLIFVLSISSNITADFSSEVLPTTIYVMIGFVIAQLVDNFFSQPFIFSKSVKSHPLEIFLIIIIAGILFGIIGMVVAVPAYTAIKVILKEFLSENKVVKKLTENI